MKLLVSIVPLLFSSLVTCASGFATPYAAGRAASCRSAYQLVAEVEGGDELLAKSSLPGSRMKNLGEVKGMTSKDGQVCKFWMTAVGEGALIKEYRARILKDASKKANFPGFRKVRKQGRKLARLSCLAVYFVFLPLSLPRDKFLRTHSRKLQPLQSKRRSSSRLNLP